ncbi:MAG: hypothetical protein A2082_05385 [Chloroflexi bacterium GWC2_70_10]|nr:MAG: hypothetical protein A2082_05385 [Chloroflexi bacterium GWC2_70_10]
MQHDALVLLREALCRDARHGPERDELRAGDVARVPLVLLAHVHDPRRRCRPELVGDLVGLDLLDEVTDLCGDLSDGGHLTGF